MADFVHSVQRTAHSSSTGSKKSSNNGNAKNVYEDVFGGASKFRISRVEDYTEIFSSYHNNSSRGCSIPFLDLPAVDDTDFSVENSKFDYSEIFGGFESVDYAVPYEELFLETKAGETSSSSEDVWTPVRSGSPSEESFENPPILKSTRAFSNTESHYGDDGAKQFNMSYHKTNQISKEDSLSGTTRIAQLNAVPAYTLVVDDNITLQTAKCEEALPEVAKNDSLNETINDLRINGEHYWEATPPPLACGTDEEHQKTLGGSGTYRKKPFMTVSEISLRTQPLEVPPPSRPPPKLMIKQGSHKIMTSDLKSSAKYARQGVANDSSPPFFDVEVDSASSAAASAAAMKEAMEQAQATLKSAREGRGGLQRKKMGIKESSKLKDEKSQLQNGRIYSELEGLDREERQKGTGIAHTAPELEINPRVVNVISEFVDRKHMKKHDLTRESPRQEVIGEWKAEEQFFELVKKDTLEKILVAPKHKKGENNVLPPTTLYDQEENEKRAGDMAFVQQEQSNGKPQTAKRICESKEDEKRLNVSTVACEMAENDEKVRAALMIQEQEELQKRRKISQKLQDSENMKETCEQENEEALVREKQLKESLKREEAEKKLKASHVREENEKRMREALQREENERREREALEREENKKREKEAIEREENERREMEALEREENERREREALVREENERRERESIEREENERREREALEREENEKKQEALAREENEKRQKEAQEREEIEKKLKETREREEQERRWKGIREREETERRLKEVREREENEMRLKEVCEKEENERRLKEQLEREENQRKLVQAAEERERRLKEAHEREETERRIKESREREENEKRLQEAHEREEHEKILQGLREREENEMRLKEQLEREENQRKLEQVAEEKERRLKEACEREETERRIKEELLQEENEKRQEAEKNEKKLKQAAEENERRLKEVQKQEENDNIYKESFQEVTEKFSQQDSCVKVESEDNLAAPKAKVNNNEKKSETIENAISVDKDMESTTSQRHGQSTDNGMKIDHEKKEIKEERIVKEREQEKERLRKVEEDKQREREREKDRIAVERVTRESHERAFAEVRERAERAAVERATAEARQRAMAEARERLEKACAEAREKSLAEKANAEAKLKQERALVERAHAEARERAEKAMKEKVAMEARDRVDRSVSEKFSATSRDSVLRHTASFSNIRDAQFQNSSSFTNSQRYGDKAHGTEVESDQRHKARLERHQRTVERAAKALAEKNSRDQLAQREQTERNRFADTLDAEVKRWSNGKEGNLRALLSTLHYILGADSGWQPIPLTDIVTAVAVKKAYRKATLIVHPDKVQQRGANIQQKYICEKVFDLLKDASTKFFNSEER